jgi:heat-inducible transcriptional repressor
MTTPSLDERRKEVLRSLVEMHVETGEPVGSESLARALHRNVSPATLRNIMADLEALGYLEQPHTSAGRLPTDEGYRVYVDSLMASRPLAPRDAAAIHSGLRKQDASANQVLENASRVLSRLSKQVGFVVVPDIEQTSFRHLDLVRLAHPRILVVMVSLTGIVTNKVVEVEEQLTQEQLQACANYLNTEFAGLSLHRIRARLLELMGQEKALYDSLLKHSLSLGQRAFAPEGDEANVYLDGAANMLSHPEFEDVERMRGPVPNLRGEEPPGEDPERLHLRRRSAHPDRPREPRPRAAGPLPGGGQLSRRRRGHRGPSECWDRPAWSTRGSWPSWTR